MEMGLIYNFSIHFYPDAWQFYLGEESDYEALTSEEAYLHLKKILEECEERGSFKLLQIKIKLNQQIKSTN